MTESRIHLPGDWYPLGLPENIVIGNDVYIDSSYAFAGSHLTQQPEDNAWVGFDAVKLPGVRLSRGCIAECRSVVHDDVPAYAVVGGDPRECDYLNPDDTNDARSEALVSCARRR